MKRNLGCLGATFLTWATGRTKIPLSVVRATGRGTDVRMEDEGVRGKRLIPFQIRMRSQGPHQHGVVRWTIMKPRRKDRRHCHENFSFNYDYPWVWLKSIRDWIAMKIAEAFRSIAIPSAQWMARRLKENSGGSNFLEAKGEWKPKSSEWNVVIS